MNPYKSQLFGSFSHGIPAGAREIGGQTQGFKGQGVSLEDLIESATLQGLASEKDCGSHCHKTQLLNALFY